MARLLEITVDKLGDCKASRRECAVGAEGMRS